jgi:hypothetical protein
VLIDGLNSRDFLRAWSTVAAAFQVLDVYGSAKDAVMRLASSPKIATEMTAYATRRRSDVQLTARTLGDARREYQDICSSFYDDATTDIQEVSNAVRAYNRMVARAMCVVLGAAESLIGLPVFTDHVSAVVVEPVHGGCVHFTTSHPVSPMFLHPWTPFRVSLDSPADGLFTCRGMTHRFGSAVMIGSDIHGELVISRF